MKAILQAGSLLALIAIMGSSCSVERKTRSGKKNVIDVGMNENQLQNHHADAAFAQRDVAVTGR